MTTSEHRLSGFLPLRSSVPTFATPLFTEHDSNAEFIQNVDRDLNFLGMVPIELPSRPFPIRDVLPGRINIDEGAHLAFLVEGSPPIFGPLEKISHRLHKVALGIPDYPFVQRSVARLLQNPDLEVEAQKNIASRRTRPLAELVDVSSVATTYVQTQVFRLARSDLPRYNISDLTEGRNENALRDIEELTSMGFSEIRGMKINSFGDDPGERNRLLQTLWTAFGHRSPAGSQFSSRKNGAFYGAETLEGAVAETAWHYSAQFAYVDMSDAETVHFEATEWDIRAEVADLREFRLERDPALQFSQSQAIGDALRDAGFRGVVYRSPFRSEFILCAFYSSAITGGRFVGRLSLNMRPNGDYSFSIER